MKNRKYNDEKLLQAGEIVRSQNLQLDEIGMQSAQLQQAIETVNNHGDKQDEQIDCLLSNMDGVLNGIVPSDNDLDKLSSYVSEEIQPEIEYSDTIYIDYSLEENERWNEYLKSSRDYAQMRGLTDDNDPFYGLLSKREQEDFVNRIQKDYYERKVECDWIDYAFSTLCGSIAGIVDIFFVGMPGDSALGNWTDKQAEKFVSKRSEKLWEQNIKLKEKIVEQGKKEGLNKTEINQRLRESGYVSAFGRKYNGTDGNPAKPKDFSEWVKFLEAKYAVPYDETQFSRKKFSDYAGDSKIPLDPTNHHLLSLGHSSDLIGLIFSIVDQFLPEKTSFIVNGSIKRYSSVKVNPDATLRGDTLVAKIYSGIVNWFNHCISDLCGSSGSKGRGSGLANPGYELLMFLNFGSISETKDANSKKMTIAELACEVFQGTNKTFEIEGKDGTKKIKNESYDLRFGMATMLPCLIIEILIRFFYVIRRHFAMGKPLKECMPVISKEQPELRRMFFVSYGVLCVFDDVDAIIAASASGGNVVVGAMHLNYYAQTRLALLAIGELRAMHRRNNIDIDKLIEDVDSKWKELESDISSWNPYGI